MFTLAGLLLSQALSRNSSDRAQLFDCFKAQSITNCADGCYFEVWLMLTTTLVVDSRGCMQVVYTALLLEYQLSPKTGSRNDPDRPHIEVQSQTVFVTSYGEIRPI